MEKQAYHIVLTTHNSRTSQRMLDMGIQKGKPFYLNLDQEIALTIIIGSIIKESKFNCLAYNVCKDHVHMILVCTSNELTNQVQKIKSISSKLIKRDTSMEHVPLKYDSHKKGDKTYTPFWSQKFFRVDLDVWTLDSSYWIPGYGYKATYLFNAMNYIRKNRLKHNLIESERLEKIIDSFIVDQATAFDVA